MVTVGTVPSANLTQSITLNNSNCGTAAPVLLTATTDASSPTYAWYKNGELIVGETASTYSAVTSGSYAVKVTSTDGCAFMSASSEVATGPTINLL